jgi:ribosomal protein S18 acetylase RimI-like enzyme
MNQWQRKCPMDNHDYVESIIRGMERYFRLFALADNIRHNAGDIEWVVPLPGTPGPSIVFRVSLDEQTARERINERICGLREGTIPSFWVITPNSTPKDIVDILVSKGFTDESDREHPELGMALDIRMIPELSISNRNIAVTKVASLAEFQTWMNIVNEALHGWNMLALEHYASWLSQNEFSFYLASFNGTPVATASTLQDGIHASVEFVSTLKEYRNRGVATFLCLRILNELMQNNVKIVTLRASHEAIPLYRKLGFKPYFELIPLSY